MIKNVSKDMFIRDYNSNPPSKSLCISILNSSDNMEEFFPLADEWDTRLRFVFDDIDHSFEDLILFNKEHATLILKVILDDQLNIKSEFKNIIIHCTAGVSRSAAIALFLNQLQQQTTITDLTRFGWSCFNRNVFSTLLDVYCNMAEDLGLPNYLERTR